MRILFVAMAQSVHIARWVAQLSGTGWDLHLFPSEWPCTPHPDLRGVTLHGVGLYRHPDVATTLPVEGLFPFQKGGYRLESWMKQHIPGLMARDRLLARTIKHVRPDLVHSLEMQRAGYLTMDAYKRLGGRGPRWLYSCWGNDIYHFVHQPGHRPRIEKVLRSCNYLMTDCERDRKLAEKHGFRGTYAGYFPGPGGFDVDGMRSRFDLVAPSCRRTIAVKGYQHWSGRALVALQAIHRAKDVLGEFKIRVYSAVSPEVRAVVDHMATTTSLDIEWVKQGQSHEHILDLFAQSRIAIGNSISDGTPNTLLEAMVLGAFPVQSNTVSTEEWVCDGRNGFLVNPESAADIERALRLAVSDDRLVDEARERNLDIVRARIDVRHVQPRLIATYRRLIDNAVGEG